MKNSTPNPELIDQENPEWTNEMFQTAQRGKDVLPVLSRGKQKKATKQATTIRFSPEVLDYFKSTGKGWQTRINTVLKEYVATH